MADYIYLLRTRLTAAQLASLEHVRNAARTRGMNLFLVGGAVRDLTSGSPIRDLDIAVQGNALKLRKDLEKAGGVFAGEHEPSQALYFTFPGGVRLEVSATLTATYPKPGKPVYKPANILDDLRRRDFTANAMAISLNDGSFGLLMDPLNGIADLENRELRLVSNYGFIEDPSLLIRATRFGARLGWQMEEKTRQRYDTAKSEGYISALNPFARSYELEEIFHEEDPLRVLRRLEHEGWAKVLFPAWHPKHAAEHELDRLRDLLGQFESVGIHPDPSPAYFPLLTAKLPPKDTSALKRTFARPGYVAQIAALESSTKAFGALFTGKSAAEPSAAWKLLYAAEPLPILWLAHSGKAAPIQNKFKAFFNEWPQARNRIPYQLMQEMRIVPELPIYNELLDKLFFALMDNELDTPEAARAFLEPYSPPAPPPVINLRRRAVKRETKPAKRSRKAVPVAPVSEEGAPAEAAAVASKAVAPKAVASKAAAPAKPAATAKPAASAKPVAAPKAPSKPVAKAVAKKAAPKPAVKKAAVKKSAPIKKQIAKKPAKPAAKKAAPKKPSKPAKKVAAKKPAAKKVVAKSVKKPAAKKSSSKSVKPAAKKKPAKKTSRR